MADVDKKVLRALSDSGVVFSAHLFDGTYDLSTDDVISYLKDPVAFAAAKHQVPVSLWKQWTEHYDNPVCQAKTKAGRPCRRCIRRSDLKNFSPTFSCYCTSHIPK